MELQVKDAGDGVLNVSLAGRLDTPGVDSIETLLTAHLVPRGALGRKSGKLARRRSSRRYYGPRRCMTSCR